MRSSSANVSNVVSAAVNSFAAVNGWNARMLVPQWSVKKMFPVERRLLLVEGKFLLQPMLLLS
jgi:hypothetical protein